MTSSNRNIFCVTGHLCREFTGDRWIPSTKASDAELWCLICTWLNDWVNNREAGDLKCYRTHYDVTVMSQWETALLCNGVSHWLGTSLDQPCNAKTSSGSVMTKLMSTTWSVVNFDSFSSQTEQARQLFWDLDEGTSRKIRFFMVVCPRLV